jgi:hypothetical protein
MQVFRLVGQQSAQNVISYRDAQDRVAALGFRDEDKALALCHRPELSGDSMLAGALVNRALEAGWVNLANSYIEANPYKGDKDEELWDLQGAKPGSTGNVREDIVNSMVFHLQKTSELDHVHIHSQIESIAKG